MNRYAGILISLLFCVHCGAQPDFFVDGFHGGLYGHYPLDTYTQFIVDQLEAHPDWRIGLEIEPETWDSVKVRTPEAYRLFKAKIIGPQVEVTNPTYAQPYLYNISGESIIRQFQYGMQKLRSHFPGLTFTTYSSEEPCFTSQLPQLLRLLGFKYISLKCPDTCWGGYTEAHGQGLVSLVGPDGSSMPAVPRYACEDLQPGSVWQTTAWTNSSAFLDACRKAGIDNPVGMCYQDAGWTYGPWLRDKQGTTQYVRWSDYIEQYASGHSADEWHWTQEDIHPALMWGTQVLQRIGRQVRRAENHLVQAEKLATIMGQTLPQEGLDEAWRTLMLAQHHDSWIVPYNGLRGYGTWADAIRQWTDSTVQFADHHLHSVQTGPQVVVNTTGHTRHEVIEAEGCLLEVDVPAFGYAPLPTFTGAIEQTPGSVDRMENDLYRIIFDLEHGGTIKSLIDKRTGREFVDTLSDRCFLELSGYFPKHGGFRSSTEQTARLTWLTHHPLRQQVRIDGEVAGVPFTQTITLTKGQPRIDCRLHIGWTADRGIGESIRSRRNARRTSFYDTRFMLRLMLPAALQSSRLSKDAPFDVCESRQPDSYFNRWDSIRHNVILNWVDLSEGSQGSGLALFTDHTTSYTYGHDEPLSLTVQYSGPGLWWRGYPIDGPTDIDYALVPHQGTWSDASLPRLLDDWQNPLTFQSSPLSSHFSLLSADCQVSAAKLLPDGSLLLRLYNDQPADRVVDLSLGVRVNEILVTDLDGHVIGRHSPDADGTVHLSMPRFGIKNLLVR